MVDQVNPTILKGTPAHAVRLSHRRTDQCSIREKRGTRDRFKAGLKLFGLIATFAFFIMEERTACSGVPFAAALPS